MNLETINKILLFGKSRAFSEDEFQAQLKHHKIEIMSEYSDTISLVVDGRMMTPYEQIQSDTLYEEKSISAVSIDLLEKELAACMDENTLLMSLKLSHDKARLKSFIENSMIQDALFFKLIKMYKWSGEDFFENDDNRDVSAAFISRFYENIERNHNVQYATTGFIHLVKQAKNSELLNAISLLEPMQLHPKIEAAIAMNIHCSETLQKRYHKRKDKRIDEALSFNKNLCSSLIEEFVEDEELGSNMAKTLELSEELFNRLSLYPQALALNESLSPIMQEKLFVLENNEVSLCLAQNSLLDSSLLLKLLSLDNTAVKNALYENRAMPVNIIEKAYTDGLYSAQLAKNENTPVEILYQLQLDSRYERYVKTNAAFGKHIQSENIGWLI